MSHSPRGKLGQRARVEMHKLHQGLQIYSSVAQPKLECAVTAHSKRARGSSSAWLEHFACQLGPVGQVFFIVNRCPLTIPCLNTSIAGLKIIPCTMGYSTKTSTSQFLPMKALTLESQLSWHQDCWPPACRLWQTQLLALAQQSFTWPSMR